MDLNLINKIELNSFFNFNEKETKSSYLHIDTPLIEIKITSYGVDESFNLVINSFNESYILFHFGLNGAFQDITIPILNSRDIILDEKIKNLNTINKLPFFKFSDKIEKKFYEYRGKNICFNLCLNYFIIGLDNQIDFFHIENTNYIYDKIIFGISNNELKYIAYKLSFLQYKKIKENYKL